MNYTLKDSKALPRLFFFLQISETITISTPPRTSTMTAPPAETAMIIRRLWLGGGAVMGGTVGDAVGESEADGKGDVRHSSTGKSTISQSSIVEGPCWFRNTSSFSASTSGESYRIT